ncbi:hypothetical protein J6Q66_01875 [bacterium]|nr:hypothetical protein [bacterium]
MKERELNAMLGIIPDPEKNVYDISSWKKVNEIQRMIRIFKINEEQHNKHLMLSIKNIATFRLVLSNN